MLNRDQIRVNSDKTPYEPWKGRLTSVKHLKVFGNKFYIKIKKDDLGKFDFRVDGGILPRCSSKRKGYKCNIKYTKKDSRIH